MDHVQDMIEGAAVASPEVRVLLAAARATRKGAAAERLRRGERLPRGARPRLSREEGMAAATVVTRQMRRLGVTPHSACAAAEVALGSNNFHRFHLTMEEMDAEGVVRAAPSPERRVSQTVGAYVDLCRETARIARRDGREASPEALWAELAKALSGYLVAFECMALDEFEAIAADLRSIAAWLSASTRPGPDGRAVDVRAIFDFERREGLQYRGSEGYGHASTDPDNSHLLALPRVPLFVRKVARCTVPCFAEGEGLGSREGRVRSGVPLGDASADVLELVSLAISPTGSGAEAVFVAEPFLVVTSEPGEAPKPHRLKTAATFRGGPYTGHRTKGHAFFVGPAAGDVEILCDVWRAHVSALPGDESGAEEAGFPRVLPVEAETIRCWADTRDERWMTPFWSAPWPLLDALPHEATLHGGIVDASLLARIEEATYRAERPLHEILVSGLADRRTAMEAFEDARHEGLDLRKAVFRRTMGS